uniref:Protein kinase domain-containing protein n=1 Tax=Chromera velia CCMP2878 TaxID=1169474 RepID=A0A0G4FSN8_9ALVE|eukprot:Cvel_18575.t1-p1 / transcript=Cvel_18575.t1 / gene=Cvel_18575 / organism=Chromera_velia_CCMP2878 / gene_product=Homoserine kinase, putative / transcript_product=Homoserine kinase, putative / location=Cvel_scaffold1548:43959-45845(+) / protein_length=286 / sequence_SO=supercontig / SO=protein_coding / is_pseudo=false
MQRLAIITSLLSAGIDAFSPARFLQPLTPASRSAPSRTRLHPLTALQNAPKTGQHSVEDDLRDEAISLFFQGDDLPVKTTPTSGGVNNVVMYVETNKDKRYILRIYNNGNKSEKVVWEHEILAELNRQQMSFKTPKPLPALGDSKTHKLLSSGAECCVFEIIPGELAKTTSPREVGKATGELCDAMSKMKIDLESPIPPYYEVFDVHHSLNKEGFYREITRPREDLESARELIEFLVEEIRKIEPKLDLWQTMDLPSQIIHGDLHYDNVMVVDDVVSGLLDFEFCE